MNGIIIYADKLSFNRKNTFEAIGNVKVVDEIKNYLIYAKKLNTTKIMKY